MVERFLRLRRKRKVNGRFGLRDIIKRFYREIEVRDYIFVKAVIKNEIL